MLDIFSDREGGLETTRHPVNCREESFLDKEDFLKESERVYDVYNICLRCVSLCESFPTLFDTIDESETFELDGVDKNDFQKIVDECYMSVRSMLSNKMLLCPTLSLGSRFSSFNVKR